MTLPPHLARSSFWAALERRVEESPDIPALYDEHGACLTFAQLRERSEQVAAGLHARGIGAGSRVTWQLPTRIETVVLVFALCRLGAVQNPVIPVYGRREVGFILRQTQAELFVVPGTFRGTDFAAMAEDLQAELGGAFEILRTDKGLPDGDPAALPEPPATDAAQPVRWVFYTSGTSADPKGVRHTDGTISCAGYSLVFCHALTPADVGSIAFPVAHAGGPQYLASMLQAGFPALLLERFHPPESLEIMRKYGVSVVGGGTAFYTAILSEQRRQPEGPVLPSLRILTGGGGPKPPKVYDDVLREVGRPILHGLGMTESPAIAMGSLADTDEQRAYTEGGPVPGMSLRVMRPDGSVAAPGEEGEIQLRGECMTVGYVDEELNADSFTADGWLRGGDLGYLRPDGHVVVTGRIKDIIIRKGENVSAREVEELLLAHPGVGDVAVIGLPDDERGERVCAVVEAPPDAPPIDFPSMVAFLRDAGLTVQKIPEQLEVVDALPRNAMSKVLKSALREEYSKASAH